MSTGMPELGSKISLISKADIRYEGRLFTVDPQECTIALSSVRSFGTEERETTCPIPAQNQVYDYILFRGSDIKDIRVLNSVPPQALNDPAIMQLSVPPSLGHQQFGGHSVVGHISVPTMAQYGGAFGGMGMGAMPSGLAPGMGVPNRGLSSKQSELIMPGSTTETVNVISPHVEPTRPTTNDNIIGASRSTTPVSLHSHKSSGVDQSVQTGNSSKKDDKKGGSMQGQNQQRNNDSRRRGSRSRERNDSRGQSGEGQDQSQNRQQYRGVRNQNYQNYGYQSRDMGMNQRGGWIQRGPPRARGGNRPRGGQGGYRPMNQNQGGLNPNQQGGKKKNTLKFDNDYDFDKANTEFEELRSQLSKLKVDEASSTGTTKSEVTNTTLSVINGESEKKDDSGNETGAGETEQEEEHEVFYDKKKSFFDKISCEAVERAKGKTQRTDWRQERKLNSETFGVAATRRGNFRGRGGFRGGMGYRGGFRNGYRPQQQRRDQGGPGKVTYPIMNYKPPTRTPIVEDATSEKTTSVVETTEAKVEEVEQPQVEVLDLTNLIETIEACPGLAEESVDQNNPPVEVEANN
ncbi:protein LSM14 homolog B-B isoform X2 [Coccinella septempunctata]|uniref:protein LSM14 homolog B-B isoform X2 n=1 Tax=Coccinella septempunctata TaxID=41139 RepID=UPI001D070CFA|nr:protein LSM14 homolog B-B isoform X2 [Coccinella septempunctata]